MVKDPNRRKYPLADRYIEVVSEKLTGEVLLDEALKMINSTQERMSVGQWIDLMSGNALLSSASLSTCPCHSIVGHSFFLFLFLFFFGLNGQR